MLIIGSHSNEHVSVPITLASNASSDLFNNTLTHFTNALPQPIATGRHVRELYVQLKYLMVSKKLIRRYRIRRQPYPLMMIYLKELEPQIVGASTAPLLAIIDMNKVVRSEKNVSGQYVVVDFDRAPFLKMSVRQFNSLSLTLSTDAGDLYPLDDGPPTLVQLEVSSMHMTQEFTMTFMSHPHREETDSELFPNNSPTNFKAHLHRSMNLKNWDVALASIAVPSHATSDTTVKVYIALTDLADQKYGDAPDDDKLAFIEKLDNINSFGDFARKLNTAIAEKSAVGSAIGLRAGQGNTYALVNVSKTKFIQVALNNFAARLLGHPLEAKIMVCPRAGEEVQWLTVSGPDYDPALENTNFHNSDVDVCMVYCDRVRPSIVGHGTANLLSIMPIKQSSTGTKTSPSHTLYEPSHLMFYNVEEGNFNDIGFELRRGDGEDLTFMEDKPNHFKKCGGTIITLRFRPNTSESVNTITERELTSTPGQTYERQWRPGSYKHGPGGFY
jgi:hypothetical protein